MGSCYLTSSNTLRFLILTVVAIRSIAEDSESQRSLKISGKSCKDAVGQQGVCVFKWECIIKDGILLSTCTDGFLFGTCCKFLNNVTVSPVPSYFRPQNYLDDRRPTQFVHKTSPFVKFTYDSYRTTPYPKFVTWTGSSPYYYSKWYMPYHKYTPSYIGTTPFRKTFSSSKYKNPTTVYGTVGIKRQPPTRHPFKNGSIDTNKTAVISSNYILIIDKDSIETNNETTKLSDALTNFTSSIINISNINASNEISRIDTAISSNHTSRIENTTTESFEQIELTIETTTETATETILTNTSIDNATETSETEQYLSNKTTETETLPLKITETETPTKITETGTYSSNTTVDILEQTSIPTSEISSTTTSLSSVIDSLMSTIATTSPITTIGHPSIESNVIESVKTEKPIVWNYKKQCGVRPLKPHGRIVGGLDTYFGKWPWQALVKEATWLGIFIKNKCGGVLINNRYVLTAAHCQPGFLSSLIVILGEYDLSGDFESLKPVTRNVKKMIVHRDYNSQTFENDLALLQMDQPVEFQPHIVAICLPDDKEDFTGKIAHVSGWGKLSHGGSIPNVLQEVHVPIVSNSKCQKMFLSAGHIKAIRDTFICAGYEDGGQDSCEGDSGGPLMIQRENGLWVLVGTVSHGIRCADPNLPGVYMRMTSYKTWIKTVIENA
ncbi:serine protease filzig-like [Centruroides vittatus]|uniref:serine protease filzig-like n=1 Tax=Centruroides vittatus TaxID=120091 RepID=UPI003510C792